MLTYEIIRSNKPTIIENGEEVFETERGVLKYKSVNGFERYQLWADKPTKFTQAYEKGYKIRILKGGEVVANYKFVPQVFAGKWDNYETDDPRRMNAINEVLEKLEEFTTVEVSFDYEGRTRHGIAAEVFAERLKDFGYDMLIFNIGYNYLFRITRPDGTFRK